MVFKDGLCLKKNRRIKIMGFATYSKTLPDLFLQIVANLVAADALKFEDVVTNVNQACVKYVTEGKYIHFKTKGDEFQYNNYYYGNFSIIVSIGTGWDAVNLVPNGTVQTFRIPLYSINGIYYQSVGTEYPSGSRFSDAAFVNALNARVHEIKMWSDDQGIYCNIYNPYSEYTSSGALMVMEFIPVTAREYDDANSNIFFSGFTYHTGNINFWKAANTDDAAHGHLSVYAGLTTMFNTAKIRYAFKSTGNNKIYEMFPFYFNDPAGSPTPFLAPIAQSKRLIFISKTNSGVTVNDTIEWLDPDNVTIHTFIVQEVSSADCASDYYIAIPYNNPFVYV
jgi:uncharacterized protein involved in high-affinity Fe2+ transport